MNVTKPIAITAAVLISFGGISAVTHYSNAAAAATRTDIHAVQALPTVTTLPTIEVSPSARQLREAAKPARGGGAAASTARAQMPYYSFAAGQASA